MSSFVVDLGETTISSSTNELGLVLESSARFSCTEMIDVHCSAMDYLALLTSRDKWVTRGLGFHIRVRMSFGGVQQSSLASRQRLSECLYEALMGAELWRQLHLRTSRTISHPRSNTLPPDQLEFSIPIYYADRYTVPERQLLSKRRERPSSQMAASFGHVRPPEGVPTVGMKELYIALNFSHLSMSASATPTSRCTKKQRTCHPGEHLLNCSPKERSPHTLVGAAISQPALSLVGSVVPVSLDPSMSERHAPACSSRELLSRKRQAESASHGTCTAEDGSSSRDIRLPDALKLADAALRSLITGKPKDIPVAVKVVRPEKVPALEAIAPGLWSPGYLPAVSHREPFISTISRALSSVSRRNTTVTLRSRFSEIRQQYMAPATSRAGSTLEKHDTEADNGSSSVLRLQSVVETRLWRLMQKRLYDPNAARALKLLTPSSVIEPTCNGGSIEPNGVPPNEDDAPDRIYGTLGARELPEKTLTAAADPPAESRKFLSRISLALGAARPGTAVPHALVQVREPHVSIQDARPPSRASSPASAASTASESDWWPFEADEGLCQLLYDVDADSPGWWSDEELFEPSYPVDQASEVSPLSHGNSTDHVQTSSLQGPQHMTSEPESSRNRPHPASNEESQSPPWHEMADFIDAASPATTSSGLSTPPPPPLSRLSSPLTSFSDLYTPSPPHVSDKCTPSTSFLGLSTPSPPPHSAITAATCCSGLSTPLPLSSSPLYTLHSPTASSGQSKEPIQSSFSPLPTTPITSPLSSGLRTPLLALSTGSPGSKGEQAAADDARSWRELTLQDEAIPSARRS